MNAFVTLSCLLAVVALSHGSAIGLSGYGLNGYGLSGYGYGLGHSVGYTVIAPAAVSHANMVKAAPIPVIKTVAAPIIHAPVISAPIWKTVAPVSYGYYGGYGWPSYGHGYGWNSYGRGYGWGKGLH